MRILITGTAGFIGFHLAERLLRNGFTVHGIDAITDYYDVRLKHHRHGLLKQNPNFTENRVKLEHKGTFRKYVRAFRPDVIVHLAAQAGVRYSLTNPQSYVDSNLVGTFNVLEIAKDLGVKHLLMASTSSVYGRNTNMPFEERMQCDTPLSFYAATKLANEHMAYAYANTIGVPTTMMRFFTVYGPWGRPDLALFKFTERMLRNEPIDIYNNGEMLRDFTYVEDVATAIHLLIDKVPQPYRVINIGNGNSIPLMAFIHELERQLGIVAKYNYMPMQMGDVPATLADTDFLYELTGYAPRTHYADGIREFLKWYKEWYNDQDAIA